jgi:hypothetical protein
VSLDLQGLIDEAYAKGAHDDLDYSGELDPPLSQEDTDWVASLLKRRKV